MKTKAVILGNGPSYGLFKEDGTETLVVGCNIPDTFGPMIDFTVIADEKAAIKAIREHRVQDTMDVVLGQRAFKANEICKYRPGVEEGLIDGLKRTNSLLGEVKEPEGYDSLFRRSGYFSSGHLAFKYVVENFNPSTIELYGFDSLFTNRQTTYSDFSMGAVDSLDKAMNPYNKKHDLPPIWLQTWEWLLHDKNITDAKIVFKTYEKDVPVSWNLFRNNVSFVPVLGEGRK